MSPWTTQDTCRSSLRNSEENLKTTKTLSKRPPLHYCTFSNQSQFGNNSRGLGGAAGVANRSARHKSQGDKKQITGTITFNGSLDKFCIIYINSSGTMTESQYAYQTVSSCFKLSWCNWNSTRPAGVLLKSLPGTVRDYAPWTSGRFLMRNRCRSVEFALLAKEY